jgi:MarR family transcriptional regulator, organic hydroperoxide resistance regulator
MQIAQTQIKTATVASTRASANAHGTQARAPAANPALVLDNQLCFALYSASLALTKAYKPLLRALDLTYPQYLVLLVLWEQDGRTVSDLGRRLGLDSGTLTPLLKRMEANGLLGRIRDVEDERRVRIMLTPVGRRLKARAAKVPEALSRAMQCPAQDILSVTRQVQALRQRLEA